MIGCMWRTLNGPNARRPEEGEEDEVDSSINDEESAEQEHNTTAELSTFTPKFKGNTNVEIPTVALPSNDPTTHGTQDQRETCGQPCRWKASGKISACDCMVEAESAQQIEPTEREFEEQIEEQQEEPDEGTRGCESINTIAQRRQRRMGSRSLSSPPLLYTAMPSSNISPQSSQRSSPSSLLSTAKAVELNLLAMQDDYRYAPSHRIKHKDKEQYHHHRPKNQQRYPCHVSRKNPSDCHDSLCWCVYDHSCMPHATNCEYSHIYSFVAARNCFNVGYLNFPSVEGSAFQSLQIVQLDSIAVIL